MIKRERNIIIQIIKEDGENNRKSIIIELQELINDTSIKEIENILHNSITELSSTNKREIVQSKKIEPIEKGKNKESVKVWNTRLTRAFWIQGLRISECKNSIIRFIPSKDTICYK